MPWEHALQLVEHLPGDSVSLDPDQGRGSPALADEDLERLIAKPWRPLQLRAVSLVQAHRLEVVRPGIGDRRIRLSVSRMGSPLADSSAKSCRPG